MPVRVAKLYTAISASVAYKATIALMLRARILPSRACITVLVGVDVGATMGGAGGTGTGGVDADVLRHGVAVAEEVQLAMSTPGQSRIISCCWMLYLKGFP